MVAKDSEKKSIGEYSVRVYTLEHLHEEFRDAERSFDPDYGRQRSRAPPTYRPRLDARIGRVEEIRNLAVDDMDEIESLNEASGSINQLFTRIARRRVTCTSSVE